jgi:hypothetical protein
MDPMEFTDSERGYLASQGIAIIDGRVPDPTIPPWLLLPPAQRPPLRVLSVQDLEFFKDNGYLVVKNAVPKDNIDTLVDSVWRFLEMDPKDLDACYRSSLLDGTTAGMVECYQSQEMWDNRQCPRLFGAFADLFATEKLWTSIDRMNVKLPVRNDLPDFNDDKGRFLLRSRASLEHQITFSSRSRHCALGPPSRLTQGFQVPSICRPGRPLALRYRRRNGRFPLRSRSHRNSARMGQNEPFGTST